MAVKADPGGFPQRKLATVPVVTPAQMREVQRAAQEDYAFDILQITENAGRAVARLALAMLGGHARGQRVVVLAGAGNKAASGLSAARHLANWGATVEPVFGAMEDEMNYVARRQVHVLRAAGIVEPVGATSSQLTIEDHLAGAHLVIDALAGFGLEGAPAGMLAALTTLAVEANRPVLSLDLPTGVSAATGEAFEPHIRATTTLILDLPKTGIVDPRARLVAGELYLADLGIPIIAYQRFGISVGDLFAEGPLVRLRR